ncbi:hypothetical protein F5Y10DRAFT_233323 [Nemania abortiva]|nr:hypothetical protein F5Y10DRAFT_233323 [Nemania abortiva]
MIASVQATNIHSRLTPACLFLYHPTLCSSTLTYYLLIQRGLFTCYPSTYLHTSYRPPGVVPAVFRDPRLTYLVVSLVLSTCPFALFILFLDRTVPSHPFPIHLSRQLSMHLLLGWNH